jgi:hypothetical protein
VNNPLIGVIEALDSYQLRAVDTTPVNQDKRATVFVRIGVTDVGNAPVRRLISH